MSTMLLTILKIVAGVAVLGVIALVLVAVISGLKESVRTFGRRGEDDG